MDPLLAVDVAILPPPPVAQIAIDLSAALPAAESQGLRLSGTHRPHITLTQHFVTAGGVHAIAEVVSGVLSERAPMHITITGPGRGSRSVWMRVEDTTALRDLHRRLMDALRPFEQSGGGPAAFADGNARPGDVTWVSRFRDYSSYARYVPHITLGHASQLPRVEPFSFVADTIALCHLGRFCTCREILRSWTLVAPVANQHRVE